MPEFRVDVIAGDHIATSKIVGTSIAEIVERTATRFGIQFNEVKAIEIEGEGIIVTIHRGDGEDG